MTESIENARERENRRRWRAAFRSVAHGSPTSWPQAVREARAKTDDQIAAALQGCGSETCLEHGAMVAVRRERAI